MRRIYYILLPVLLMQACAAGNDEQKTVVNTTEEEHHHSHESEAIELNNGQKWKVDDSMMVYIVDLEQDIRAFGGNTTDEYKQLALALEQNIELLTSNCSMEGKAHDELHKWLLPFIELTEQFSASATQQDAENNLDAIRESVQDFHRYFE